MGKTLKITGITLAVCCFILAGIVFDPVSISHDYQDVPNGVEPFAAFSTSQEELPLPSDSENHYEYMMSKNDDSPLEDCDFNHPLPYHTFAKGDSITYFYENNLYPFRKYDLPPHHCPIRDIHIGQDSMIDHIHLNGPVGFIRKTLNGMFLCIGYSDYCEYLFLLEKSPKNRYKGYVLAGYCGGAEDLMFINSVYLGNGKFETSYTSGFRSIYNDSMSDNITDVREFQKISRIFQAGK